MKFTQLTNAQKLAYQADMNKCPYCGCNETHGSSLETVTADRVCRACTCFGCNREWTNIFKWCDVVDGLTRCLVCDGKLLPDDDVTEYSHKGIDGHAHLCHAEVGKEKT